MSDNQLAKKADACGNDGKYPPSPDLDSTKYPEPKKIDETYYKNLPENIKASLNETKEESETTADEKKGDALAAAETEKLKANSEYENSKGLFAIEKAKLDSHTINNKKKYWMDYNKSMREALPPKSPESEHCERHVLEQQRAIFVATLKKNLATEDVNYRNAYKLLRDTLKTAENAWNIAMDKYDFSICIAHAQKIIDFSDAELVWRQGLNEALKPK